MDFLGFDWPAQVPDDLPHLESELPLNRSFFEFEEILWATMRDQQIQKPIGLGFRPDFPSGIFRASFNGDDDQSKLCQALVQATKIEVTARFVVSTVFLKEFHKGRVFHSNVRRQNHAASDGLRLEGFVTRWVNGLAFVV